MIYSARSTVANIVFNLLCRFWKVGTDGRTTCVKTMIPTDRDCGLAEWIKEWLPQTSHEWPVEVLPSPGSGADEHVNEADDGVTGVDEEVPVQGAGVGVIGIQEGPVDDGDEYCGWKWERVDDPHHLVQEWQSAEITTIQVSSMIHSARPTVSPVANVVFAGKLFCF